MTASPGSASMAWEGSEGPSTPNVAAAQFGSAVVFHPCTPWILRSAACLAAVCEPGSTRRAPVASRVGVKLKKILMRAISTSLAPGMSQCWIATPSQGHGAWGAEGVRRQQGGSPPAVLAARGAAVLELRACG